MTLILPRRPNVFTGSRLDRAAERRADNSWIAARLTDPNTLFVPVWRSESLIRGLEDDRPEAVYLSRDQVADLAPDDLPWAFLGVSDRPISDGGPGDGQAVFALDISAADDPLTLLPAASGAFVDLRNVPPTLSSGDASVLAHARGLMHWRARHRFCGVCGGACAPRSAGNVTRCGNCGTDHFPRTDPAVIMLVSRGDRCLLGAINRLGQTFYSTLAGFVEPGESLEEAVIREVMEEVGVRIGRVHYHSSQPWPFPASIMLGFYAEALTDDIVVDGHEVREARWFTRAEVRDHAALGFQLPRRISIARALIEDWVAAG